MSNGRFHISTVRGTSRQGWRLISMHGQPLGCGISTFTSAHACARNLQRLRCLAQGPRATGEHDLVGVQSIDLDSGRWVWRVEQLGVTVAVSCSDLDGRRENEAALGVFFDGIRHADSGIDDAWIVLPAPRRVRDLRDVRLLPS